MFMSNNSNDGEWQEGASSPPKPQPIIANNNANNNHVLDPYIAQAIEISFRESSIEENPSIEEAPPVAVADIDSISTSQCQCWFRKRRRLLLVGAVLVIIGVTLASIGMSIVAKKRRISTKHNDTVVDSSFNDIDQYTWKIQPGKKNVINIKKKFGTVGQLYEFSYQNKTEFYLELEEKKLILINKVLD